MHVMLKRSIIGLLAAGFVASVLGGSAYAISDRGAAQRAASQNTLTPSAAQAAQAKPHGTPAGAASGDGAQAKANLIATEFGVTPASVMGRHEQGMGFGALFQLYAIARAKGVSVDSLLATAAPAEPGDRGLALGKLKQSLTDAQTATLDNEPKNLGQLVSASHKPAHANKP